MVGDQAFGVWIFLKGLIWYGCGNAELKLCGGSNIALSPESFLSLLELPYTFEMKPERCQVYNCSPVINSGLVGFLLGGQWMV